MAKVQIVVAVDEPDEVRVVSDWFARWRVALSSVSDNTGCGCCADIWDVTGPAEALAELPESVIAYPGIVPDE